MSMRARARIATAGVAAFAMVSSGAGAAATSAATTSAATTRSGAGHAHQPVASVTAPALQIPDTAYPIPAGALFVAPDGERHQSGTQASPFQTVHARARRRCQRVRTIVLRAGIYRESFGSVVRPVTIQPYPHEQAWLSGSDVVTGWTQRAPAGCTTNWTAQFCHTCYASGARRFPLSARGLARPGVLQRRAAHAGGRPRAPVAGHVLRRLPEPGPVRRQRPDSAWLTVEATSRVQRGRVRIDRSRAASCAASASMQYGPNWNESSPTGEIDDRGAANMVFENDVFTQSANRGLFVLGAAST